MDQFTLETYTLILFNHVIIHFKAIFMNYMDKQVCKDDENKNLKMKKITKLLSQNINFFVSKEFKYHIYHNIFDYYII